MPNHVTNILQIEAGNEEIILGMIKGKDDFIDFNTIEPMPEELRRTTSPQRIISAEEFAKQTADTFGKGITQEMSDDLYKRFGANNWYDWSIKNWGTKWNAYDTAVTDDGDIQFSTAWSTPIALIEKLSKLYPEAIFRVKFADEDLGYNCGEYAYQNGEMIEAYELEFGSKEAIKFAHEVTGWTYEEEEEETV